jgi:hypothetical protein
MKRSRNKPLPAVRHADGGHAAFVYALKKVLKSLITMEILGGDGGVISRTQVAPSVGLNEASWDLRYPAADRVVLRSIPPDNPNI